MKPPLPPKLRQQIIEFPTNPRRGDVTRFCRKHKISTSVFYKVKQRAQQKGADQALTPDKPGPKNRPPGIRHHHRPDPSHGLPSHTPNLDGQPNAINSAERKVNKAGEINICQCRIYLGTRRAGQTVQALWDATTITIFEHQGTEIGAITRPDPPPPGQHTTTLSVPGPPTANNPPPQPPNRQHVTPGQRIIPETMRHKL
ncbi:MAG: hypothetical protein FWG16_05220 [Micrococcales bacterium]|nr:hypothetical protein [Micrococcales bacterium]